MMVIQTNRPTACKRLKPGHVHKVDHWESVPYHAFVVQLPQGAAEGGSATGNVMGQVLLPFLKFQQEVAGIAAMLVEKEFGNTFGNAMQGHPLDHRHEVSELATEMAMDGFRNLLVLRGKMP